MQVKEVRGLIQGQITSMPSDEVPEGGCVDSLNVVFRRGVVQKRGDLVAKGSGALDENVKGFYEYRKVDGTVYLIAASEDSLYYLNDGTWTRITDGDFTGGADDHFSFTTFANTLLVTNGKYNATTDHVTKWTGTGATADLAGGDGYQTPSYHVAKQVITYMNRPVLLNTNEDGNWCPQRVRWANVGELETWGSDNFVDLMDKPDAIVRALRISQKLAIYKDSSIVLGYYVGGDTVFDFVTVVEDVGLLAPRSLKAVHTRGGQGHLFLSREGVKLFTESQVLDVSGPVEDELLDDTVMGYASRAVAFVLPLEHLYVLVMPDSSGELKEAWALNYHTGGWSEWSFETALTGATEYSAETTNYLPTMARGALVGEGTSVKELDFDSIGAEDLEGEWESKDFVLHSKGGDWEVGVREVAVEARGSGALLVSVSVDEGENWDTGKSFTLADSYEVHRYYPDKEVGGKVRVKVRQASGAEGTFELKRLSWGFEELETRV